MDLGRNGFAAVLAMWMGLAVQDGHAQDAGAPPPACDLTAADVFARQGDAVVQVVSFGIDPHRVAGRVRPGTGSGIVLRPDLVLTNYHVVQNAKLIGVLAGEISTEATMIGGDPALDIALLAPVWPLFGAAEVEFGGYDDLVVGQPVFAIGYPLGVGKSIASGIVSGLDRLIPLNTISWTTRYIQTDAAISGGNSGGALLDGCGRVIGMVSLRSANPAAENLGYALPADTILSVLDEIERTGRTARPWHGLYGRMVDPLIQMLTAGTSEMPETGFLVETVEPGSAADRAGLRGGEFPVLWGMTDLLLGGDVILAVDNREIVGMEDALSAVAGLEIGKEATLVVWRAGETIEVTVTLEERPMLASDLWAIQGP